jgi:ABC-2 type transport system permease protein
MTDVLSSEWTKLHSLRSTWYAVLGTLAVGMGVGLMSSQAHVGFYSTSEPADQAAFDPTEASLNGLLTAQLVISVLGVLAITSEYATGMIGPSALAVPRRGRLLAAKAAVFAPVAFVTGLLVAFGAFLPGQAMLAAGGVPHASLGDPGVLRALVGCGLYLTAIGLLGLALGVLCRSTAGAIGCLVTVILLVRVLAQMLPEAAYDAFDKYWPIVAGERITHVTPDAGALSPWAGFSLLAVSVAATLLAALWALRARDI